MPNYRKKKQHHNNNNRNKNKNKNLNQSTNRNTTTTTTSSSSVEQETSEFTSVGISPNIPADVNVSRTTTTTATSTSVLDTVKGVVIVDDSSPSSNEEIDKSAERTVHTDTCSSDRKAVLTQSNYAFSSHTSSSSSSKESTEIERKLARTVSDGDSTFGNLAITDTFDAGSGKNSLKTGSTQSKDAAAPTAARSAAVSVETTRIADGNRTGLEAVLDGAQDSKVIVHKTFKKESKTSTASSLSTPREDEDHYETVTPQDPTSKVIVNKTFMRESTKSTPLAGNEADHYETVIVQETPEGSSSKVIVHQFSKGGDTNPTAGPSDSISQQKVIVHQVEESNTTRHVAAKKDPNQSPTVIAQQVTKKRAIRKNTSSLQTSFTDQSEHSSNGIKHQISKEDIEEDQPTLATNQSEQQPSRVIVHQISKEDAHDRATKQNRDLPSKVAVYQTLTDSLPQATAVGDIPVLVHESQHTKLTTRQSKQQSSKVTVHQISKDDLDNETKYTKQQEQRSSQVIVPPITYEFPSQQQQIDDHSQETTSSTKQSQQQSSKVIVHQISKDDQHHMIDKATTSTKQQEQRSSQVIVPQISEKGPPKLRCIDDHIEATKEDPQRSDVTGDFVPQKVSKVILHQISIDGDKANEIAASHESPAQSYFEEDHRSNVISQKSSTEESNQTSKVIVHQISKEDSSQSTSVPKATKDTTPQSPSKVIVHQISKEGHDHLDSSLLSEKAERLMQQVSSSTSEDHPSRVISTQTSFNEGVVAHPPTKAAYEFPKLVPNQVVPGNSTQTTSPPLYTQAGSRQQNPFENALRKQTILPPSSPQPIPPEKSGRPLKVIVHPILQERSTQTEFDPLQTEDGTSPPARTAFPVSRSPKMIVHPINRDGSEKQVFPFTPKSLERLDRSSKVFANQILKDVSSELQSSFREDRVKQNVSEVPIEAVRTSFPVSMKEKGPIRPGFFEASQIQNESNPIDSIQPKVILHQISKEAPKPSENGHQQFPLLNTTNESSVAGDLKSELIVHKVVREESASSSSSTSSSTTSIKGDPEPIVIVHQISNEEATLPPSNPPPGSSDLESKVIVHNILQEESKSAQSTTSSTDSKCGQEGVHFPAESKKREAEVIFDQNSLEESTLNQSSSSTRSTTSSTTDGDITTQSTMSPSNTNRTDKGQHLPPESEVIIDRMWREESKSTQSSSSTTSTTTTTADSDIKTMSATPQLDSERLEKTPTENEVIADQTSGQPTSSPTATGTPESTEEKTAPIPADLQTKAIDQQISKEESIASSSSEGSVLTTVSVDSPKSVTPAAEQEEQATESTKEIIHKIHKETQRSTTSPARNTTPPAAGTVIIHPIVREIVSDRPLSYRVESPQPDTRQLIVRKSKSFDDNDVVIQEMSDTSSAYDTDNPPEVSEAESETDTLEANDEFSDTEINSRVLSVQTLPMDQEDDNTCPMSPKSSQEYKLRRQQNRAALQTHFLPQFLSPIFLDSIKEENSDQSDTDRRSECSDRTDHTPQQGDLEDDVFLEGGPHAKKADAVFPKSNLDFSKKHKHIQTNVRPPKTSIIREEAPPPTVVEAKIIDQRSIEEGCSSWATDQTPESEAAEVVYIDSASSSVSDLLELDYSQGQPDESTDVRIQTPTIDLESVNEMFAYRQSESNEPTPQPHQQQHQQPQPPVKEGENMRDSTVLPASLTSTAADRVHTTTTLSSETITTTSTQHKIPDEIILETMSATVRDNNDDDVVAAAADRAQNSKENISSSCDSAINQVVTPAAAATAAGKMENLRELVSESVQSELKTITDLDSDREVSSKPIFKIGEPCSDYAFTSSTTSSTSSSSTSTTTTTTTTTTGTKILTLHDLSETLDKTQHLHPLFSSSSALDRQESLDSHASDQSHSTNQSQCTAINQGSLPHCDWNENDTATDTTYVSGSDTAGLASSEYSSPLTTGGGRSTDDTESPPIRKLRSLCTEALASLPYGEEVLEELATVAQNIGEMPYPLPELPHIQDIQVSLRSAELPQSSSVIHLTQVPPRPIDVGQKLKSPPPPPVPEPPSKYDSWLGVPTESDPSVLVCLSPSQRSAVKDDSTPDSLLDMHKKFVERRGYHEYTTKQVSAMNRENTSESVKLSNSKSPPPPPLPPRLQQTPTQQSQPQPSKSNGNETADNINTDDQNNHRLLAIIRDTHESQQQQKQSSSENTSRRTESETNTINTTSATRIGGGGPEEFASSPSVGKQTQEQRFISESNKSQSAHHEMQSQQSDAKVDREPLLGIRFPTSEYFDSIFDGTNKRFSNIETASSPGFCSQIRGTQPKRYSNIETSSFESRKCVENGKVLYDVSDSSRQTIREGEKDLTSFPQAKPSSNGFPYKSPTTASTTTQVDSRTQTSGDSENIMSAFKLNTQTTAPPPPPPPASADRTETSPPAPPVPPLPPTGADTNAATTTKSTSTTSSESIINRTFSGETKETVFDDFRQRAKEAAAGTKKSDGHEKLFKDFDELSNLLKDELESGKRRPPATLNDIPSSVSDYNRVARESRSHVSSTTTSESSRREQMKLLADEIDRTAQQRQQQRKEMRIPIHVEKPTPTPPRSERTNVQQPRTHEIPVQVENGSDTRSLRNQRSFDIPIRVEQQSGTRPRTYSEHQRSHEAPVQAERPIGQPGLFRRAESMFNVSDSSSQRHMLHDDWMKYVGDIGSSDTICKPFQREVEICYLGRRPNIRAPRLSASTSDLSSSQSYDTYGAYDVRRTSRNQTPRPQQPPPRRFVSTQSMIDTTPITACVSSGRSPVPDRQRRSSLPREIHDQQMKYISNKENQLQIEFERLENERRQLIDEMNRAQINQRMNREAYRQRQLPPLTEDESFRQQMAEEWLDKVAEREERRLQKIIKISKINADANLPTAPPRRVSSSDIGDEFLRRVKERRSKLHMPSDSDWESGAESQPIPRTDGSRSENEEPPITVLEGHSEASLKQLPKHLREFAKLTNQVKEEHREETTENSSCSATKKSSVVTTVKTSNAAAPNNYNNYEKYQESQQSLSQQDADRVRDLEQLSQGKRQNLVTILRHKKPAESGSCQPSVATGAQTAGASANSAKRRKQTRFLLTPNRRSWSESDLLREIDKDLVLAKGFLYAKANEFIEPSESDMFAPKFKATTPQGPGVWTPKTPSSSRTNLNEFHPYNTAKSTTTTNSDKIAENRSSSACGRKDKGVPAPPPPPLWTPQPERKQFRPVHFESPTLQRRYVRQQSTPSSEAPPPPWSYTNKQPFPGYQSQGCTNLNQKNKAIPWPPTKQVPEATDYQNGTVVIDERPAVDEQDDDSFTPTTSIAEKIKSFERSHSNSEVYRPLVRHNPHEKPAIFRPNEVIYSLKNEYMSEPETEYDKPKKMAQLSRRQYDGIGPTTQHGMPLVLRSEVKEPNQHEWYKRIFQTIHKQKNPDDYVTIRYKCPRGRYPYKSNGYMSEPEPHYDSDYSTVKYRTLERRRLQSTGTGTPPDTGTTSETLKGPSTGAGNDTQVDTVYGTMPNPVKSGQGSYKVQPGRIEDYITGHSSVSEKEKKEWWDEVMDIFNGWLKDNDTVPRVFIEFANEIEQFQFDQQKLSPHYTEGNLSRALLKEQGYTSDSNLVFRKKDVPQHKSLLSPVEQKHFYKSVQAGGQPPLLGFRKPAPEKPKETEFEYLPITPTLTKIRLHSKEAMPKKSQTTHAAQRDLICYPITNVSRPIDMFAPFPKHVPSFIPMNQPPLPPNRKSSRTRTTRIALKISPPEMKRPTSANSSRHEACFQTKDALSPLPPRPTKYGTITLKKTVKRTEPLVRSKSAGAVVSLLAACREEKAKDGRVSRKQQTIRLSSCSPVRSSSRLTTLRTSSRSPVAFGRSVSKERSFAEEKKRIEETMPSIRADFTASTNILRDPRLRSPDQVKRAVRSYAYPMERSKSAPRAVSPAKPAMSTYMSTYVERRAPSPTRKASTLTTIKTTAVLRSKSQSSKLSQKATTKPMVKASSTVSLARTSSTFSVDSTASKVKPIQKKPLTITRPSARTETEKPKRKPLTISSSKSDSNVLRKIKENSETKEKIVKAIPSQQKIIRTNHFFENLFMRDASPKKEAEVRRQAAVHQKTRYWNSMSLPLKKSVPELRQIAYRSLSPPARPPYVEEYQSVEHFHSDEDVSEFGDRSGRTEDLVWQYEQRSRSQPRPVKSVSDIARPESPAPVFPGEFSPTREIRVPQTREMRSPSRRRIKSFRGSQRGETNNVIRASSLSSADDRSKQILYRCDDISHSANSLEYIERHSPNCRFKNSDRFIDLNRFYSTLERVGQLERATSATSLKPIRRDGEAMDFEEWRKLRFHERAERELNYLVGRLKDDQKQKDFLFRPKDVEDVKWSENKDLSLRSKDKSVEDLRENFEKKIHQEWLDESKRQELESKKDTYKPYWRGSSVVDLASTMEIKYNPDSGSFGVQKVKSDEKPLCLSNRLISTLSKDQLTKITRQLNEIYSPTEPRSKPDVTEDYVITVDKDTPANALKVRCNSSISKEELIGPVLRRKEASVKPPQSKSFDRLSKEVRKFESELTETEKRRLSQTLSREIQGKARSGSPVMLGRETRGAIAAENAKSTMSDIPPPPPLPKDLIEDKKPAPAKPRRKTLEDQKKSLDGDVLQIETTATDTVEKPEDTIFKKIQYFEERQFEEPAKTVYHAREDSSPDEDEIMRVIEENIKARAQSGKFYHQELSSSCTDLKDLFGEREASRINFPLPCPPPPPDETVYHETSQNQHRSTSLTMSASRDGSLENLEAIFRSRSISPQNTGTPYLHRVQTGEVRKIKDKFESLGRPKKKKHFFALSPLRKVRSDPELSNDGSKDTFKTVVHENEVGDVSWITHKFEARNHSVRGRSRLRKPGSPIQRIPLRKDDRLMPHIDIISKTASLKQGMMKSRSPSPSASRQQATLHAGEVERIRCLFETSPDRETPHLGTSSPELRDISEHLTASWIAHKYPKPLDNDLRSPPPLLQHEKLEKSVSLPVKVVRRHERIYRSRSISPPKTTPKAAAVTGILKPRYDFFANQKFDPSIHRPKARYVPDSPDDAGKKTPTIGAKKTSAVKFKDSDEVPPIPPAPPTKGVALDSNGFSNLESPNRYFESDVNIHYKTPIRYEYKDPIPEEELAIRQAESMQKLYQEERRRKYLQELQDMNSRRHTDNFISTQKSPIPLNRYDDFNSDLAPKSPNSSNYPRTIARALYNFQGQTARELTFKKGDVIYIRRQIDKNWYEGEHNAMIGLLPSNYVELITKDGVRQPPKKPSEGQARAKYNFQAQSGIELSINKGEHVTLTRRVDDNWFEGKIANRKGIFPVSYVEVLVDIGAEDKVGRQQPASQSIITQSSSVRPSLDTLRTNINNEFNSLTSNGQQPPNGILRETRTLHKTDVLHVDTNTEPVAYRALYKYRPQNTDELELQEGDIVYVLEKCDDGWFVGTSQRNGCFGTFPGNYVERV